MAKQIKQRSNLRLKLPVFGPRMSCLVNSLLVLMTLAACFLMLDYSCIYGYKPAYSYFLSLSQTHLVVSLLTMGALWAVLTVLFGRIWLSCLVLSVLCGGVAVANYFVLMFHGMPLSFLVLRNFGTAMDVAAGYPFRVDRFVASILVITAFVSALSLLVWKMSIHPRHSLGKNLLYRAVLLLAAAGVFSICYLGANPLKPQNTISWSWQSGYWKYGYLPCTVESFFRSSNLVVEPDTYSRQMVESMNIENQNPEAVATPDVILILNESFYDLGQITDLQMDGDYMAALSEIENLKAGYAVSPSAGGGTNSSEYELLTSNSMMLLPGVTPFNSLNLEKATSIVSHLKAQGYTAVGSHCETPSNYSRSLGYPALGFDHAYFMYDHTGIEPHGSRGTTDRSVYQNMIRWYEQSPEDRPRFQYVLTYYNHGPYEWNDPEYDTVHTGADFGENTQTINEFLTGVDLACRAFRELTEYFADSDRPVIICMVGDHAPSFAPSIVDSKYTADETDLLLRRVPLLYWANFPMKDVEIGTMSMNYVVPTLLELADMKTSPYYSFQQQARQQVPIITSYGSYYDAGYHHYTSTPGDGSDLQNVVDTYLNLAYHNIKSTQNRELFTPYP